jgi:hypothetical protein
MPHEPGAPTHQANTAPPYPPTLNTASLQKWADDTCRRIEGQGVSLVHDIGLPPAYGVEPIQVGSVDTTLADAFVGKSVDVLMKPLLHEAHLRHQVGRRRCWPETKTTLMGSHRGLSMGASPTRPRGQDCFRRARRERKQRWRASAWRARPYEATDTALPKQRSRTRSSRAFTRGSCRSWLLFSAKRR